MNKITAIGVSLLMLFGTTGAALAAPSNQNPHVVADYQTGTHGIVGENDTHTGSDVVMQTGNNGNFQQWFYGTSPTDGVHGDHSVWKVSQDGSCPANWDVVQNANPAWGDYLTPNVNYCVHTNDFHPSN